MPANLNSNPPSSATNLLDNDEHTERRADPRRPADATVWLMDDDLTRLTEVGRVDDLSFSGARIELHRDALEAPDDWRPGVERLVFLDDSSGADPFARHRPALVQVVWSRRSERVEIGVRFVTRRVGWTTERSGQRPVRRPLHDLEPNDTMLDSILERIVVDATRGGVEDLGKD
ncbi:MAG: PilZ domain-containing protein [Phycisphaerales bacterium]